MREIREKAEALMVENQKLKKSEENYKNQFQATERELLQVQEKFILKSQQYDFLHKNYQMDQQSRQSVGNSYESLSFFPDSEQRYNDESKVSFQRAGFLSQKLKETEKLLSETQKQLEETIFTHSSEVSQLKSQLTHQTTEIMNLKTKFSQQFTEFSQQQSEIRELKTQISGQAEQIQQLRQQLSQKNNEHEVQDGTETFLGNIERLISNQEVCVEERFFKFNQQAVLEYIQNILQLKLEQRAQQVKNDLENKQKQEVEEQMRHLDEQIELNQQQFEKITSLYEQIMDLEKLVKGSAQEIEDLQAKNEYFQTILKESEEKIDQLEKQFISKENQWLNQQEILDQKNQEIKQRKNLYYDLEQFCQEKDKIISSLQAQITQLQKQQLSFPINMRSSIDTNFLNDSQNEVSKLKLNQNYSKISEPSKQSTQERPTESMNSVDCQSRGDSSLFINQSTSKSSKNAFFLPQGLPSCPQKSMNKQNSSLIEKKHQSGIPNHSNLLNSELKQRFKEVKINANPNNSIHPASKVNTSADFEGVFKESTFNFLCNSDKKQDLGQNRQKSNKCILEQILNQQSGSQQLFNQQLANAHTNQSQINIQHTNGNQVGNQHVNNSQIINQHLNMVNSNFTNPLANSHLNNQQPMSSYQINHKLQDSAQKPSRCQNTEQSQSGLYPQKTSLKQWKSRKNISQIFTKASQVLNSSQINQSVSRLHSSGKENAICQEIYQGEKLGFMRHGRGKQIYANNEIYEGEWKNGQRHGYGVLKIANKDIYIGDWENDKFDGNGRLQNQTCTSFTGQFNYFNFDTLSNSWISYSGQFKQNTFHGLGALILSNGEQFLGQFVYGKLNGEGNFYKLDGKVEQGTWRNNKLIVKGIKKN